MKKLLLLALVVLLMGCNTSNDVKKDTAPTSEELKAARTRDMEWKNYVAGVQKNYDTTKSTEDLFKLETRFEAFNPYSGNFRFIKSDITKKHQIEKYETVKIPTRDGLYLDGWFIPVKNAKGTLIILHGRSSDASFGLSQSKFLLSLGYQILVYNARFWNFSEDPYKYVGFTGNDIDDVGDVIKFLSARKDVDMAKLGLMGFSYGAEKAVLCGGKYPELKYIIADAAPVRDSMGDDAEIGYYNDYYALLKEKYNYDMSREDLKILKAVKLISPRPLLLLHGEKDTSVPVEHSRTLFENAGDPKEIHTFPNSGHCLGMMTGDKEKYISTVNDFLTKYLSK